MKLLSSFAIPVMLFGILLYALLKKNKVYDSFLQGAAEGLRCTFDIIPPIIGLCVAVSMLRASGFTDIVSYFLTPVLNILKMPSDVIPLALLRPVSGSASLAVLGDIFKNSGTDSYQGLIASVMMGSTETTFYTIAVYFGAVKRKNTGCAVKASLAGDITGAVLSVLAVRTFL